VGRGVSFLFGTQGDFFGEIPRGGGPGFPGKAFLNFLFPGPRSFFFLIFPGWLGGGGGPLFCPSGKPRWGFFGKRGNGGGRRSFWGGL